MTNSSLRYLLMAWLALLPMLASAAYVMVDDQRPPGDNRAKALVGPNKGVHNANYAVVRDPNSIMSVSVSIGGSRYFRFGGGIRVGNYLIDPQHNRIYKYKVLTASVPWGPPSWASYWPANPPSDLINYARGLASGSTIPANLMALPADTVGAPIDVVGFTYGYIHNLGGNGSNVPYYKNLSLVELDDINDGSYVGQQYIELSPYRILEWDATNSRYVYFIEDEGKGNVGENWNDEILYVKVDSANQYLPPPNSIQIKAGEVPVGTASSIWFTHSKNATRTVNTK